jgi:K+-sensing histidine kinase KdpD
MEWIGRPTIVDEIVNQTPENGSYFASAARADTEELQQTVEIISNNPVINGILDAVYGLLAVLNEHRQILAVNPSLLIALGIREPDRLLGLRPGEAVRCVHAHEEAAGCGTSRYCSTCGAAIAMVVALAMDKPAERECAISTERDGKQLDLYFHVRCCSIVIEGRRFLLLFLQDISAEQQRCALERAFFHDVGNLLEGLLFNCRLLTSCEQGSESRKVAEQIEELASRLATEVRIQRALSRGPDHGYSLTIQEVSPEQNIRNLEKTFSNHPVARGKTLCTLRIPSDLRLSTDSNLLERVLMNMLINAFEATPEGGEVKLWVECENETVSFCVWNRRGIPEEVARRVFQRNFTTKEGSGRGLGAYVMKLLGETYLRGKVDFTTSEERGTLFQFSLKKGAEKIS